MDSIIVIPALNPDERLIELVSALRTKGASEIVVVNDGSSSSFAHIFDILSDMGCTILKHSVNLGKGYAIKTALNYIIANNYFDKNGVVTCDADGQHTASDISEASGLINQYPESLILGTRRFFDKKNRVPILNLLGNTITRLVFYFLTGLRFEDTQCGLRGFPKALIPKLIRIPGDRFDYENNMLLYLRKEGISYVQYPIETIYKENGGSHFNKIADSMRIIKMLISFAAVPLAAAFISLLLFVILTDTKTMSYVLFSISYFVGSLYLSLYLGKGKKILGILLGFIMNAVLTAAFFFLKKNTDLSLNQIWWILILPVIITHYKLWLNLKFGKKPVNIKSKSILAYRSQKEF